MKRLGSIFASGCVVLAASLIGVAAAAQQGGAGPTATPGSIIAGRAIYMANCSSCHGVNGRAQVETVANAADLTKPQFFKNGHDDAALYRTIRSGLGNGMPPFASTLNETESWDVVHFVQKLGGATAPDKR